MIGFSFLARDGMRIQAYLHLNNNIPLKQPSEVPPFQRDLASLGLLPKTPQPTIVFIHGGPDERISYGYDPFGTWMSDRGYTGLFINFRGTAGFGKRYKDAGNGEWGKKMQTDIDDGIDFAINNGIADKNRIAVMGNSYGGFSTLSALELTPEKFVCGVDICGPTDLELQTKILLKMEPSFGMIIKGHYNVTDRDMETLKSVSPIYMVSRIRAPLIVIHGGQDDHVPISESANLVDALVKLHKPVKFIEYPDEGHMISKGPNFMSIFGYLDQFFHDCLGGPFEPYIKGQYNSTDEIKVDTMMD
uniref:Prolyl endopeptidase n=1 Tax=Acrobeloides nanus TaxID=290746 RepID=A0A914EPA3_9BILA